MPDSVSGIFLPAALSNGDFELEEIEGVKSWVWGLIGGPLLGLLVWYFKRSTNQSDKRLDGLEADLEEVREVLAKKIERNDLTPIWEKITTQDQNIRDLGVAFSRELREQIDTLRSEGNEHQRQTNERLDRILTLMINRSVDGR